MTLVFTLFAWGSLALLLLFLSTSGGGSLYFLGTANPKFLFSPISSLTLHTILPSCGHLAQPSPAWSIPSSSSIVHRTPSSPWEAGNDTGVQSLKQDPLNRILWHLQISRLAILWCFVLSLLIFFLKSQPAALGHYPVMIIWPFIFSLISGPQSFLELQEVSLLGPSFYYAK